MLHQGLETQSFSPKVLAQAIGVSESSVKRWIDAGLIAVSRTAGGHRRISFQAAVRFIRKRGMQVVHPELLGLKATEPVEPGALTSEELSELLMTDQASKTKSLILNAYLSGASIPHLCDGPIRDAMHRVGSLWHHSKRGVFVEHRATHLCIQALSQVQLLLPPASPEAPAALGGAPTGDEYMLPSMMAALTLADLGYRETNLGPQTPIDSLLRAVDEVQPALVWLSVSTRQAAAELAPQMHALTAHLEGRNSRLILGGQALTKFSAEPFGPQVVVLGSMVELNAFARDHIQAGWEDDE